VTSEPVVVVGAGLAGLLAARRLDAAGVPAVVLDGRAVVGGRLATRDLAGARLDHGAQFFTVRSAAFAAEAEAWLAGGAAYEWCRGFDQPPARPDGFPRYAATSGMAALAASLAAGVEVHLGCPVRAVSGAGRVVLDGGREIEPAAVLLTPPVPESLALVDAGAGALPAGIRAGLDAVTYQPTLAVLAVLDRPSRVPPPGAVQPGGGAFSFVADNQAKGISALPAVTLHAGGELSAACWDDPDAAVLGRLLGEGRRWLGSEPRAATLERWRHARPTVLHPERCVLVDGAVPLVFAGDGFGEARMEGAACSGWAAASALLERLGPGGRGRGAG
jgi:predicted NAD/FAD-dependent oxidoreductase